MILAITLWQRYGTMLTVKIINSTIFCIPKCIVIWVNPNEVTNRMTVSILNGRIRSSNSFDSELFLSSIFKISWLHLYHPFEEICEIVIDTSIEKKHSKSPTQLLWKHYRARSWTKDDQALLKNRSVFHNERSMIVLTHFGAQEKFCRFRIVIETLSLTRSSTHEQSSLAGHWSLKNCLKRTAQPAMERRCENIRTWPDFGEMTPVRWNWQRNPYGGICLRDRKAPLNDSAQRGILSFLRIDWLLCSGIGIETRETTLQTAVRDKCDSCSPRVSEWCRMIGLDQIQISKAQFTLWSPQHPMIQNQQQQHIREIENKQLSFYRVFHDPLGSRAVTRMRQN
jgi:hypothetical protein